MSGDDSTYEESQKGFSKRKLYRKRLKMRLILKKIIVTLEIITLIDYQNNKGKRDTKYLYSDKREITC